MGGTGKDVPGPSAGADGGAGWRVRALQRRPSAVLAVQLAAMSAVTISPATTYTGVLPPVVRHALIVATIRIQASEAGMRTFQLSFISWS